MDYDINKVNKGKKGEAIVLNELKGIFGDSALFFQNVLVFPKNNSKPFECDIICVSRRGLFVFEVKNWEGHIEGDMLSQKWGFFPKSGEKSFVQLDNPVLQNNIHRKVLSDLLNENVVSVVVLNNVQNTFSINKYSEDQVKVPVLFTTELNNFFENNYLDSRITDQQFYNLFSKLKDMENKSNGIKTQKYEKESLEDNEFLNLFSKDEHNVIFDSNKGKQQLTNEQIVDAFNSLAPDKPKDNENVAPFPNVMGNQTHQESFSCELPTANSNEHDKQFIEIQPIETAYYDKDESLTKKHLRKKKGFSRGVVKDVVRILVPGLILLTLLFLPWNKIGSFLKKGIDFTKRVKQSINIQNDISVPETVKNRHKYTIEELSSFSVATAPEYQEGKMSICQSFAYRVISNKYVENHETKVDEANLYITPVEYITGSAAQDYYDYLSQVYKFSRPLRQADNEYYAVIRMYVWFLSDTITSSSFTREAYSESIGRMNQMIRFYIDDGSLSLTNYYLSNETGQNEYLTGYYIEDLDGNAIKDSNIISGVPIEIIYLIPLSGDFKYSPMINPDYFAHYGTSRARLILD